jgi:hypothetical protein
MINAQILEIINHVSPDTQGIHGPLSKFINSKKAWKPFPIEERDEDPISAKMGTHKCIQKCIALALALELPVGLFAMEGSGLIDKIKFIPDTYLNDMALALEHNAIDEENHYNGFQIASVAYDVPLEYLDQVNEFRDLAMALDEHPVLMAGFLELTVFFPSLGMLRKWGSSSLKNLVQYVSRDESCHVNTNYHIVDQLGLKWNDFEAVDQLREDIIHWLTSDLKYVKEMPEYWQKVSSDLKDTRQAPDLKWTRAAMMPAFFEMQNY